MNQTEDKPPIRVMVVDDSAFMRFTISEHINKVPDLKVVGTARDGNEAISLIPKLQPDVITLDVEMPNLDGISTLRIIMAEYPRPVIMLSSLTTEGASATIQALTLGAVDFVSKPSNKANVAMVMDETITKIRQSVNARVTGTRPAKSTSPGIVVPSSAPTAPLQPVLATSTPIAPSKKATRNLQKQDKILIIGSSTGGPRALNSLVPALSGDLPAAVVIVQHMPAGFTRSLAERLDSQSPLKIKEAEAGDRLEVGLALMAPGGFHMVLDDHGQISLNKNQPVHGVRPSVDVTMTSIVQNYGPSCVGVILTGMGRDGTNGCTLIHSMGGKVIAEDESTCVVWGMPRSVFEAGVTDQVLPLPDIPRAIEKVIRG